MKRRTTLATTNALLALIAFLLTVLALLLYQQRPVTRADLMGFAKKEDKAGLLAARLRIPLARIEGTVDVNVENTTLSVEIDR